MPRAPTKLYRTGAAPILPVELQHHTDRIDRIYETQMRSIQKYFHEKFYLPSLSSGGLSAEQVEAEVEEHRRLLEENDEENRRVAEHRAERLAREHKLLDADLVAAENERINVIQDLTEDAQKVVELEKRRSLTYITLETLDEAIESALANPVHYDFAIDKVGHVYVEGKLHPYAMKANAIPETSSNTEEMSLVDHKKIKLEEKILY